MQIVIDIPEDIIESAKSSPNYYPTYHFEKIWRAIVNGTQPKTGRWITINDCELNMAYCSECGDIVDSRMISKYPYCHCGAKMEIEE